jgi:hypothetical protein
VHLVQLVEPSIQGCHPLSAVELGGDGTLCERRDVELGASGLFVELVRKADVPASHTQRIHTPGKDLEVRRRCDLGVGVEPKVPGDVRTQDATPQIVVEMAERVLEVLLRVRIGAD